MDAARVIKRFDSLEKLRYGWEGKWQQCADMVYPTMGQGDRKSKDNQTNYFIHEPTATAAMEKFVAALESILTPRTQRWHSLVTGWEDLDKDQEVAAWLEALRDALFRARYASRANFANQILQAYISLAVHGTAVVFIDDDLGKGLRYQCVPIYEAYIEENAAGKIDTVFRAYTLTARQARQEFGDELPEAILKDSNDKNRMETPYEFIHGVMPVDDDDEAAASKNFKFVSYHIARQARKIVRKGGYRYMPYAVSRFIPIPGQVYGYSPTMVAMPYIMELNAMEKTTVRMAEKISNPPVLAVDDEFISAFSFRPGHINYGGLDQDGNPRLKPMDFGANLPTSLDMENQRREAINAMFHNDLFQILVEGPRMTATEVLTRARERAEIMAPLMGRQHSELLHVIIEREMDILQEAGAFDHIPMPEKVAGIQPDIRPRYETPMSLALEAQAGEALLTGFEALGALAGADPGVMNMVDFQKAGKKVWQTFAAPMDVLRTDEEIAELQEQQRQQQEAAMMMQGLQQAGAAGKDIGAAVNYLSAAEAQTVSNA